VKTPFSVRQMARPSPLRGSNGVATGPDGRLFVAQFLAGQVSAVDLATGDVEVIVAPGGPVQSPDDLAFGPDGSMYLTDLVPGRVWRRTPDGTFVLVADGIRAPNGIAFAGDRLFVNEMVPGGRLLELGATPRTLTDGLAMGNAMQLGPDGHLYYPHMITGEVFRIALDGGAPELVADQVAGPVAVRFDRGGALLILSRDAAGTITRIDGGRRTTLATGIVGIDNAAFDDENRMFVSSYATGGITEVRPDGGTRDVVPRGLTGPYGVTVDPGGRVHVADHYGFAGADGTTLSTFVHGIAADGDRLHLTSQYGQVRTHDRATGTTRDRVSGLDQPLGVAVGPGGTLVVAEAGAGRVVTIGDDDTVMVVADGFGRPVDVAFDDDGRCYVSDEEDGTVHRVGDGDGDGDGDGVIVDGLDTPQGLAVRGGLLFVAETGRGRVQVIDLGSAERVDAFDVPLSSIDRTRSSLFAHGVPGIAAAFAGLAAGPQALYLAAEGAVLELTPTEHA
jgi:sugar lactone lactonase YvrE